MITSLFSGLNTASRAMQNAQRGLIVHSGNIAQANDPNYTRRTPVVATEGTPNGSMVTRARDAFLDERYRNLSASHGEFVVRKDLMRLTETVFGDPVDGGLRKAIDTYFDAWQALAENPADAVARLEVLSAGRTFAHQIKSTYSQVDAVEQRTNEQLTTQIDQVNADLNKVSRLNRQIAELHRNGMDDSSLRDERDAALDELAAKTGATMFEQEDGSVRVVVGSIPVVDGPILVNLKGVAGPNGPVPTWDGYHSPVYTGKGAIAGLLTARDGDLRQIKQEIDSLGKTVADEVNKLHRTGTGLNGDTGLDFFVIGAGPADIAVNPTLRPEQVGAGAGSGLPSDGGRALDLAHLGNTQILPSTLLPGQLNSARTAYRNLIGWVGSKTQELTQLADVTAAQVRMGEQQRQSSWGVSIDEEVANLTVQQKAFAAAARVMDTMDRMLDDLINRTGR